MGKPKFGWFHDTSSSQEMVKYYQLSAYSTRSGHGTYEIKNTARYSYEDYCSKIAEVTIK